MSRSSVGLYFRGEPSTDNFGLVLVVDYFSNWGDPPESLWDDVCSSLFCSRAGTPGEEGKKKGGGEGEGEKRKGIQRSIIIPRVKMLFWFFSLLCVRFEYRRNLVSARVNVNATAAQQGLLVDSKPYFLAESLSSRNESVTNKWCICLGFLVTK